VFKIYARRSRDLITQTLIATYDCVVLFATACDESGTIKYDDFIVTFEEIYFHAQVICAVTDGHALFGIIKFGKGHIGYP
jgi:hypothetical protein